MLKTLMFVVAAMSLMAADVPKSGSPADPVIDRCSLASIENQAVPSSDNGVLTALYVKEGLEVAKGDPIALVDDREAKASKNVKELEYRVADQKAKSDVAIQIAEKGADVYKAQHDRLKEANDRSKGTVSKIELQLRYFEYEKAVLQAKHAKDERDNDTLTAQSKKAEADFAQVQLDRRTLVAPFSGIVTSIYKHPGEWLSPGDKVIHLVRIDRLYVNGIVDASKWSSADLENRRVTVDVDLPHGRTASLKGQIDFVNPVVSHGEISVRAEIDAPVDNGRPIVTAGMLGRMTIHVSQPAAPQIRPTAAAIRSEGKR